MKTGAVSPRKRATRPVLLRLRLAGSERSTPQARAACWFAIAAGPLLLCSAFGMLGGTAACAQDVPAPETRGVVVANMDRSVKPGDNFYEYANGDWLKRTEIPPDRAAVGIFSVLGDLSNKNTAALIAEIAKSNPAGP